MSRGNGRDLADELRSKHPRLKVLFITGYTGSASVRTAELGPDTSFLSKPFSSEALARKIRVLMDTALPGWPATKTGRTALDDRPL
jgi:DNA-binding NarL/FixJ family response regulator